MLVAGAVDGSVLAYDTARMKLLWRKSLPYGAVSSMVGVDKNVLVMTGSGRAVVLDVKLGNELAQWASPSKFQVSKMASLGDGRVLLGGSAIVLVDGTTGARLGKWTGHATPVISLSSSSARSSSGGTGASGQSTSRNTGDSDQQYFCSAATGDRTIAVWSARKKAALAQVSLNHPVAHVSMARVASSSPADQQYQVVAVTMSGDIHVFKFSSGSGRVVEWAASEGGSGNGLPAVQVAIDAADEDGVELTVAFGNVVKPKFSKLRLTASADGSIVEVAKPQMGDEALLKSMALSKGASSRGASSHIPLAVAETNEHAVLMNGRESKKSKSKPRGGADDTDVDMEDASGSSGSGSDENLDIDGEDPEKNLTFAERIAALKGRGDLRGRQPAGPTARGTSAAASQPVQPVQPLQPKADSLAILLSQALENEDNALLERCLSVKSAKTVSKTARQLSPGDATTFVRMLVQKLQASPRRAAELTAWIKAVLVHHAGYFAGTGACRTEFSSLQQIIDARLSTYSSLVSLNGRLDLVLACARHDGGVVGGGFGFGRPLVTATIDEDGGIEVQDAAAAIGLDEDEDEDEDDDDEDEGMETDDDVSDFSDE